MDIEAFSDENFDAVAWVNAAFKAPVDPSQQPPPTKDARVSALVSKLQLYVQQLNATLEDTSQQLLAGMPRIVKDAQHLQSEALSLRQKMHEVQTDIEQVQRETGACMEHLERLDVLQTKLRTAKQGLQESDGWGRLTGELDDALERSDLAQSQDKLQALQKSLCAQSGLAGQSEREAQLEGYKNRIEALASPAVVEAFSTGDVERSRRHVQTFAIMQRVPQLTQYYRTVQRNRLQQCWSEVLDQNGASGSTGAAFLLDFYERLLEHWQQQAKWCAQVFDTDGDLAEAQPSLVLCEVLENLQPNRESAVSACLKSTGDRLAVLQDVSAANVWLIGALHKCFAGAGERPDEFEAARLCAVVCDWFQVFVGQYANVEQTQLVGRLAELQLAHGGSAETVRALGQANATVCGWLGEARARCRAITQDCGLPALVLVFNGIIKAFLDKYKKAQQQLHASRSIEQNWALLQSCIGLLQHIGDFHRQLLALERDIGDAVLAKRAAFDRRPDDRRALTADGTNAYAIGGKRERSDFAALVEACDASAGVFRAGRDQIVTLTEYVHDTTLASVFAPIETQMRRISAAEALQSGQGGDLPAYSFAPQELITEVGQYLLTLPQHLEPLLLRPSAALREALELCDARYSSDGGTAAADVLLSLLVDETCALYEEQIARIATLSAAGAKQLATDVEYLGSVLEELGHGLGTRLQQTVTLLRAAPDGYLALSAGCDPKLVTRIRQMRNIVSMESNGLG